MPPSPSASPPLSPTYYLDNFEELLRTVVSRYDDLLAEHEIEFVSDLGALSTGARCLWLRLLSRRGPLFRRDRLAYDEVPDLDSAVDELLGAGFLDDGDDASPTDLLALLAKDDLIELLAELGLGRPRLDIRKGAALEIVARVVPDTVLAEAVRSRLQVVRPRRVEDILPFQLLFFGNLSQDWREFVLRDIHVWRYESYELRGDLRLFPHRKALDDELTLRLCRREVRHHLAEERVREASLLAQTVSDRDDWVASARPLVDSILTMVGRTLERCGDFEEALRLYDRAQHPPARERRCRVLARLGLLDEALEATAAIDANPLDEAERLFAPRFAHRLRRRLGTESPRPRTTRPERRLVLRRRHHETIEEQVVAALSAKGVAAFHAENWLWKSLFGLAFWDIIFAPVAGAFQHPFQAGPLDLFTPAFRDRRARGVELRLREVENGEWEASRILHVFDRKEGIRNRLVTWAEGSRPLLERALANLEGHHLALVFDRLSRDLRRYRRGFPDLFVARPDRSPGFELLEIKGPGDQLRPEQRTWLEYLESMEIPVAIARVEWRIEEVS